MRNDFCCVGWPQLLGAALAALLVIGARFPAACGAEKSPGGSAAGAESRQQAAREAAFAKMLSGATLEGSFTQTGPGADPTKLDREKYTLGEVKKVAGNVWQFPARIQYGGTDVTLPILLPVHWAGDTPVAVVHTIELPGIGAVSARVLFFEGHYAGYWKHGERSGNLFGRIHSPPGSGAGAKSIRLKPSSGGKPPAGEQPQKERGE